MWIIASFFDFIFPPKCAICKQSSYVVCDTCVRNLRRAVETPFPWIYSFYSFRDPCVATMIHTFKYYHRTELGKCLTSSSVTHELAAFLQKAPHPLLVPIPMARLRKWSRGGNHAESIAKVISKETGIPYESNFLLRKKNTRQQAKSSTKTEREQSIKGAFALTLKKNILNRIASNQSIILVDDVTTTGATLQEAKKTLEKNRYTKVLAITLAH